MIIVLLVVVPHAPAAAQPSRVSQETNLIHFGDLIDVDVVGSFEYDWRGSLNPEGFLDGMDKIQEQIFALCRSEDDIAQIVTREYSAILRDPKVVVRILDRSNRAVAMLDGAVRLPHRFQIKRPILLNELLIMAGGITDTASGEIRIFRPQDRSCVAKKQIGAEGFIKASQDNDARISNIKIDNLLKGIESANPRILSGDVITVIEALPIYVIGGINVPKQVSSRSNVTLTRAIASAGGLAKNALPEKVTIFRRDGKQSVIIEADLKKIEAKAADDPVLKAFDIVDVGQKGRPARKFPPVVDNGAVQMGNLFKLPLRIVD